MTELRFGRVVTAMVTPFTEDGQVNYQVAEELSSYLADNGSDSIVVCGTTGESPTLSWTEEHELFQVVQKAVAGKAKVIAGTGSNCTAEAITATQKAEKLGLDGSLQVVPYYNKPPQDSLYLHFKTIAESAPDLPIMLYNVPGRTGQNLQPETIAKLAQINNIISVKEASGNIEAVSQIKQLVSPDFTIYSGDDSLTLPLLSVGGVGVVSVASHLIGKEIQEMIQSFESGQVRKATAIHLQLYSLFKVLFCTTNPIPVKTALQLQGWKVGDFRLPLSPMSDSLKSQLAEVMKELNLLQ